jgi:hypothetical protein
MLASTGFLERALAFYAAHGIVAKRLMTDNGFSYVKNRSLRELLRPARRPPPHNRTLPATHQRQGRTLPPNDGARMGVRTRLPLTSTNATRRCHTGSTTTTAQAPQLARRPAPNQPRSQRPWVGQLVSENGDAPTEARRGRAHLGHRSLRSALPHIRDAQETARAQAPTTSRSLAGDPVRRRKRRRCYWTASTVAEPSSECSTRTR